MIEVISHPFPGVTIIDRIPGQRRPLQQGDHFRYSLDCGEGDQVFEVAAVSHACAMVRSLGKRHVEREMRVVKHRTVNGQDFKVDTGEVRLVSFDQPQGLRPISRYSFVEVVEASN